MFGFLNIDKPPGVTSRHVVDRVGRLVKPKKAGHAGTLDPLATGVLVVCVGAATRLVEYVQKASKVYQATFLLGSRSDTDDVEGNVQEMAHATQPTQGELEAALPRFVGTISQRPPNYSAVRVGGRRAYKLARAGRELDLQPRQVHVHRLEMTRYVFPQLELEIECGTGTYVRSLGRDLAEHLGTGAVMSALRRTSIGRFHVDDAWSLETLDAALLPRALLPPTSVFPSSALITLTEEEIHRVLHGQFLRRPGHEIQGVVPAVDARGRLLAVLTMHDADQLRPLRTFRPDR